METKVLRCPHCKPIGTRVMTRDGRRLGFVPEALYVGYLVAGPRSPYKKPPISCPNCGSVLEIAVSALMSPHRDERGA